MDKNTVISEIRKVFYEYLDGNPNSPFLELEFTDDTKYIKHRKNKAIVLRGSIKFLEEKIIKVIKGSQKSEEAKA